MKIFLFEDLEGRYLVISKTQEEAKQAILDDIYGEGKWLPDLEGECLDFVDEYSLTHKGVIQL